MFSVFIVQVPTPGATRAFQIWPAVPTVKLLQVEALEVALSFVTPFVEPVTVEPHVMGRGLEHVKPCDHKLEIGKSIKPKIHATLQKNFFIKNDFWLSKI